MLKEILLPDLGEGIDSADVSEVLVSASDKVSTDDIILVLESDKASMEIPTEYSGEVEKVFVKAGDEVRAGSSLISLKISSDLERERKQKKEESVKIKEEQEKTTPLEKKKETALEQRTPSKTFASPGVRRLARELEIELSRVNATGFKGRTTKNDLLGYIKQKMSQAGSISAPSLPKIDFSQWGNVEKNPLTKIQKITGARLQQAWKTIPHVTQFDEANITALEEKRKELKKEG